VNQPSRGDAYDGALHSVIIDDDNTWHTLYARAATMCRPTYSGTRCQIGVACPVQTRVSRFNHSL